MLLNRLSQICLSGMFLATCIGQSVSPVRFEVASVKPSDPNQRAVDFVVSPGGRLRATNLTLAELIREAYQIKYYQLAGGPGWLDFDCFNVEAKGSGQPTRKDVMAMLQQLLLERFQLKLRSERREGSVYELLTANREPKLKPSAADVSFLRLDRNTPRDLPGVSYTIIAQKISMAKLADDLTGKVQRPVLDHTGIGGEFDFRIDYAIEGHSDEGRPFSLPFKSNLA